MKPCYFIDGYNLLFRFTKKVNPLEKVRKKIISTLNELATRLNLSITIVFDGKSEDDPEIKRGHFKKLEIIYTPKQLSADQYLIDLLESSPSSGVVIVTSDLQLAKACQRLKAKVLTIEEFITLTQKKLSKKKDKISSETKQSVETASQISRYLKIFQERFHDFSK